MGHKSFGVGHRLGDLPGCLQLFQYGHGDIDHRHVRNQIFHELNRRSIPSAHQAQGRGKAAGAGKMGVFSLPFSAAAFMLCGVTAETFRQEIAEAMKAYEKYVICIDKTPDEFHTSLTSLLNKAIKAYETRGPQLRHGIALDRQITVILSQSDNPRPLCGIYFNLHSPYQKSAASKPVKAVREPISGSTED